MDRFFNRKIIKNNYNMYNHLLEEKDKKSIDYYKTAVFKNPSQEDKNRIEYIDHIWTQGDRLYKLAYKYLRDKSFWWLILRFNDIPSEVLIKAGDIIKIPTRSEDIVGLYL